MGYPIMVSLYMNLKKSKQVIQRWHAHLDLWTKTGQDPVLPQCHAVSKRVFYSLDNRVKISLFLTVMEITKKFDSQVHKECKEEISTAHSPSNFMSLSQIFHIINCQEQDTYTKQTHTRTRIYTHISFLHVS